MLTALAILVLIVVAGVIAILINGYDCYLTAWEAIADCLFIGTVIIGAIFSSAWAVLHLLDVK